MNWGFFLVALGIAALLMIVCLDNIKDNTNINKKKRN